MQEYLKDKELQIWWDSKDYKIRSNMDKAEEWATAWNKLKPDTLDISGGEPFIQPEFIKLLELLDDSIKVAITTNLTQDISQFAQKFKDKVFSMTLSYHPTQNLNPDIFWGRVMLLKNRGFKNLTVNFVGYPDQLWLIASIKAKCKEIGVRFHLDPYAVPPKGDKPYTPNQSELEYLDEYTKRDRQAINHEPEKRNVTCDAGMTHIQVHPTGIAYRCGHISSTGVCLGNILDKEFTLNDEAKPCAFSHICWSCDKDFVQGSWKDIQ